MKFAVMKVVKYGTKVYQHPEMDELRHTQPCLNCTAMYDCDIVKACFELCKKYNVAYAMTRCPHFVEKEIP